MIIVIKREDLLSPLQYVNGVIGRRQTLPILSNLLLVVDDQGLSVTGTDMEVEMVAKVQSKTSKPGDITVSARKLLDICRTLPDNAEIELSVEKGRALVRSGKSRFNLATLPAADFPSLDRLSPQVSFDLSQATLRNLFVKTQFAMAHQDVRYYLNGLMLEVKDDLVRAVATDGHRLSLCEAAIECSVTEPLQIIIPRKGIQELTRLLQATDDPVTVEISNNHIRFAFIEEQVTCKLIDGRFPDYERVLPDEGSGYLLMAEKETLKQSLTRASILSNEKYRGVRVKLKAGIMQILAHNPEQEEAEEEIEVEYDAAEMEIGFNVTYLLDALSAIDTPKARCWFYDGNSSCLIRPEGESNCRFVVMPMRL